MKNNIILIGMPSCGKSTIGVVLAKSLGYHFVDSDLVIQEESGQLLSEIIDRKGIDEFNRIENEVNAKLNCQKTVIATGGSVIYGSEAMEHLKSIGLVVYIELSFEELVERIGDLTQRGVSIKNGQSFFDLYNERIPLYEKYADITIHGSGLSIRKIVEDIKKAMEEI